MRIVKCINGHFFDGESYELCPHCNERVAGATSKKGFFGRKKEVSKPSPVSSANGHHFQDPASQPDPGKPTDGDYQGSASAPTEMVYDESWQQRSTEFSDDAKTEVLFEESSAEQNEKEAVSETLRSNPEQVVNPSAGNTDADSITSNSLSREIGMITASSGEKTVSFFQAAINKKNQPAAVPAQQSAGSNPPVRSYGSAANPTVGWIVCVKGPHFGESFCLGMGKNSIGRGPENDISVYQDGSISRSKHALIVFEPKKRKFYLQPGDSSGLTYLNDEYITESTLMKARDVIELGISDFILVPLCGEDFDWETYVEK